MDYDNLLGQQSISGKTMSLILCAWKTGHLKSSHISLVGTGTHIIRWCLED